MTFLAGLVLGSLFGFLSAVFFCIAALATEK